MLRVKNLLIALALAAVLTPADAFAAISGTSVFNVQSAGADGNSGNGGGGSSDLFLTPCSESNNVSDCYQGDAILSGQLGYRGFAPLKPFADSFNLVAVQFGAGSAASVLHRHIDVVIRNCAKKQMLRVHASAVANVASRPMYVAFMQDTHSIGDWPISQFPGNAMGKQRAFIRWTGTNVSVARAVRPASPKGAARLCWLPNEGGKSLRKRPDFPCDVARQRTEQASVMLERFCANAELFSALQANAVHSLTRILSLARDAASAQSFAGMRAESLVASSLSSAGGNELFSALLTGVFHAEV